VLCQQLVESKDLPKELQNRMGGPWGAKLCSVATSIQSIDLEPSMRISNLHEFWFTSKDGLRVACETLSQVNRGGVRSNLLAWLSAALGNQFPHKEPL